MFQFRKFGLVIAATIFVNSPASAASEAELNRLFEMIGTPRLLEIMRIEGLEQADELRESMFPTRDGGWDEIASSIYDTGRMDIQFRGAFNAEMAEQDVSELLQFFESDLGKKIVGLELSGREALLDPDVEASAVEAFAAMQDENPDRVAAVTGFIEANDLVELNVMGGLNSSLSFYHGLSDGGGFDLPEDEILEDVWSQEDDIRADTEEWIYAYLAMAYEPLKIAEIDRYSEIATSDAGRALNRALFAGFDEVFNDISYALGRAASRFSSGEDI